ncbi:hypothetical protein OG226_01070 [Streptomyces sp. NBC_01261]|uniref:hypothetical protein n=1 Tax=Streptomyces sp. NBC_01261 TaxID=2903802 RepID=UPI002E336345|nr:hypothetical protein [Streptomyces sp. NBC_01261]
MKTRLGALAEDSFSFNRIDNSDDAVIVVNNNTWSEAAGTAEWWADPSGSRPGDALTATDILGDGYGIEAHLSTGRVASTRGHDAIYSVTATGNLTEGNTYTMWVCVVKGDYSKCSSTYSVTA